MVKKQLTLRQKTDKLITRHIKLHNLALLNKNEIKSVKINNIVKIFKQKKV